MSREFALTSSVLGYELFFAVLSFSLNRSVVGAAANCVFLSSYRGRDRNVLFEVQRLEHLLSNSKKQNAYLPPMFCISYTGGCGRRVLSTESSRGPAEQCLHILLQRDTELCSCSHVQILMSGFSTGLYRESTEISGSVSLCIYLQR